MEKPLISCPACSSRLIYPTGFDRDDDGSMIIERRCPECEHADIVVAEFKAALTWIQRERRIRRQLMMHLIELELDEILDAAQPAEH